MTSSLDEKKKLRSKGPDGEKAKENQTTQDLGDQSSIGTGGLESEGYSNSPQPNQQITEHLLLPGKYSRA